MSGFFPVDRGVFTSSVWLTGTPEERVLWFWLLGNRDDDGVVRHRELAIADGAKLPRAVVEECLKKFSEPDPDSRTRDNDGRRIGRTPEGFVRILNHELYYSKDYSTPRWRKWDERRKAAGQPRKSVPTVPTRLHVGTPLENVGPTKDKDKDKDTTERIAKPAASPSPPPRSSKRAASGNGHGAGTKRPLAPSWSAEAASLWVERFEGTAPGGRIGQALKPLVAAHGWPEVRTAWRSYLAQAEAEFASPQRFAATYGRWSGSATAVVAKGPGGKATVGDANMAVAARFVARGGAE